MLKPGTTTVIRRYFDTEEKSDYEYLENFWRRSSDKDSSNNDVPDDVNYDTPDQSPCPNDDPFQNYMPYFVNDLNQEKDPSEKYEHT